MSAETRGRTLELLPPEARNHYTVYNRGLDTVRHNTIDAIRYTFDFSNFGKIGLTGLDLMPLIGTGAGTVYPALHQMSMNHELRSERPTIEERYYDLVYDSHPGSKLVVAIQALRYGCKPEELPLAMVDYWEQESVERIEDGKYITGTQACYFPEEDMKEPRGSIFSSLSSHVPSIAQIEG